MRSRVLLVTVFLSVVAVSLRADNFESLSLEEMDALWDEVKTAERQ